jgi:hypothetical protein
MKKIAFIIALLLIGPNLALAKDFHGYECSGDCSGHEAGYEWAEDNDIEDESDCSGQSQYFNEGCQAYIEENVEEDD